MGHSQNIAGKTTDHYCQDYPENVTQTIGDANSDATDNATALFKQFVSHGSIHQFDLYSIHFCKRAINLIA